jgi:hypothetical protein
VVAFIVLRTVAPARVEEAPPDVVADFELEAA